MKQIVGQVYRIKKVHFNYRIVYYPHFSRSTVSPFEMESKKVSLWLFCYNLGFMERLYKSNIDSLSPWDLLGFDFRQRKRTHFSR